ncbi:MAG TPA: DUF5818 domain-containing protein [Actinomycetota bacterium]|nr:DUF5818 domain-containing protein [Actinomycetota bacterium]
MRQTTVLRPLAGLLLAVALLAACADQDASGGAAGGGSDPTTTPETLPTAPTTPTPPPTTAPGSGTSQITATGMLRDGVEPGCVLLEADQGTVYLLVGGDRGTLSAGGRVQVTGRLAPDLLSTCQQGQPLQVSSIKPVP